MPRSKTVAKPAGSGSDDMREHILKSAQACFAQFSVPKTTVDDIVKEAQISRTTFYKHFRNRSQVVLELSIRETLRINAQTKRFHQKFSSLEDAIVESIFFAIKEGLRNPVIKHFIAPASDDLISEILDRSDEIWALQTDEWSHLYQLAEKQGRLRKGITAEAFARWITTIQYIMLTRPLLIGASIEEQKKMLHAFLVPGLILEKPKR